MPQVTPIYAAVLTLLYLALAWRVIQARGAYRVTLGTGGQASLEGRMRAHGNFAEYVPLALLLLLLLELRGTAPWLLHGIGIALVVGRALHAAGVSRADQELRLRMVGIGLTFTALAVEAVSLLIRV